jgi:hypothetical protein
MSEPNDHRDGAAPPGTPGVQPPTMEGALAPAPLTSSPPPAPPAAAAAPPGAPAPAAPAEPPAAPVPYPPSPYGAPTPPPSQSYAPAPFGGVPQPYAPSPYGGPPQPYGPMAMCALHADTPAVGLCARCGGYACAWCVRTAADGATLCASCLERLEVGGPVPWDLRPELGLWRSWWRTFKESLSSPNQFYARVCHSPFSKAPVLYSTMSVWLGQSWLILLYAGIGIAMAVAGKEPAVGVGLAIGAVVGLTAMAPVSALMQIYLIGGITHLFARAFGGKGSYQQSARALGFAIGPYAIGIIPYLGGMAAWVVSIVQQVYAMKHAHGLTGGKAAAAVLLPLGILLLLCCGGYIALIATAMTMGR